MGYWVGIALIILIAVFGLIYSMNTIKRAQDNAFDRNVTGTAKKHQMLANPIFISYVLFPILVIVVAMLFFRYF